jgi:hypothetical protein
MGPIFRFLSSLRNLAQARKISIEDAYKFAKQEFGEVNELLKLQINKIFKDVEAPSIKKPSKPEGKLIEASFKPGKSKYSDKIVEESPSQKEGIMEKIMGASSRIDEIMKEREAMYRPKKGLDLSEGITRALARKILDRKRIQIAKGQDPIDVFTDIFGEAIGDVKNLADEMVEIDQAGGGMKNMDEMLEAEGLYDIEIPESPQTGMSDEELMRLIKEEDVKSEADEDYIRKIIDPEEPEEFATGGRAGYGKGGGVKSLIKLINKKFGKGTVKLGKDVKRPESAKMREAFEAFKKRHNFALGGGVKAVLKIIEEIKKLEPVDAMKEVNKVISKEGKYKDLSSEDTQKIFEDTQDHIFEREYKPSEFEMDVEDIDPRETILPTGDVVSKQLKVMRLAEDIQPGLFEKLTDMQLEIITKYGDVIDDNLLKQIVLDKDPNNQALALAQIEEAKVMLDKGMDVNEILRIQGESLNRRKQAEGGLAYLMGL